MLPCLGALAAAAAMTTAPMAMPGGVAGIGSDDITAYNPRLAQAYLPGKESARMAIIGIFA